MSGVECLLDIAPVRPDHVQQQRQLEGAACEWPQHYHYQ